ncbi:MEKHLA domain-containing protein [Labrys sp. KNU-23]|uniref:MEKHLA domain-containing protein n=1 Tax=Labrys sp. KNU-23 TaxID=2789216 RepID=UPI0011EE0B3F|nr:MEKHLA domain-containing protein [Labrys sp. KNU-23]QEN86630.1 MEKHLA domain-containing protein [Labrys sp. KNU-23]
MTLSPGLAETWPDLPGNADFATLLDRSLRRLTGRGLLATPSGGLTDATWLYAEAPFCLLAHDTRTDPVFIYGNKAVQACFEYDWEELTQLPSRLSAEFPDRDERQRLLDTVKRQGFIADYSGVRIAKSGRRFFIENATVWEVIDDAGCRHGQAALFASWRDLP